MTTDNRPLPEAIDGRAWRVIIRPPANHGSGILYGVTDLSGASMQLPPENHPSARFVRLHELAHARWTPRDKPPHAVAKKAKATVTDVQACEDLRVQSLLHAHRLLPRDLSHRTAEERAACASALAAHVLHGDPFDALEVIAWMRLSAGVAVHKVTTPRSRHVLSHLAEFSDELDNITDEAAALIGAESPEALGRFDALAKLARSIAGQTVRESYPSRKTKAFPFRLTVAAAGRLRELLEQARPSLQVENPILPPPEQRGTSSEWGTLEKLPALPLSTAHRPKNERQKRRSAVAQGARLGSIRRLLTDGRAFRRDHKTPQKGGTVLIDASGSMDLSAAQIRSVLDHAPAATIAMYSGAGISGAVSIIAKGGRMADDATIDRRRHQVGLGNIVDGPALEWLGKQAEPRTWICDGAVTGVNESRTTAHTMAANRLMLAGKIRRHHDVASYLDTLNR